MADISVVITFYNQDYSKLFQSLYSVIRQENVSFEIVITDDGSTNFDSEKIRNWFKENSFSNYTIVANEINQGTVINTLTGWENATSKYVKMLSPGDLLYDKNVLHDLVDYMNSVDADICFGKIASYRVKEDGEIELISLSQPKDLSPYINYDKKQIQKNYLMKKDYPCGMSFAGKRELMISYIKKIAGKARFYEDCTYILMVAAGKNLRLWNHYVIWYEVGEGISTSGSKAGGKRAFEANKITYDIIRKEYPEWEEAYEPYSDSLPQKAKRKITRIVNRVVKSDNKDNSKQSVNVKEYDLPTLKKILSMNQ